MVWGPRKARPRITSPFSGAMEEMTGNKLPVLPSLQHSGVTLLSWPVCAVPSWQGRSQILGLLVGPFRSASYAKSPRPNKTKGRLSQVPSWKPASLAFDAKQLLQLLLLPSLRVLLTASVLCPQRGWDSRHWCFPFFGALRSQGSLLRHLPACPALLPCKFLSTKSSKFVQATSEYPAQNMAPSLPPNYFLRC